MKSTVALPVLVASSLMLAGCFDGSSSTPDTSIRVIHAVSDAPSVNVSFNGTTRVRGADFKQAAVLTPNRGNYSVDVDALLPTGDTLTVIEVGSTRFDDDTSYDIIATGKVGAIQPLVLTDDGERESENSARLRVAHLSPAAQDAASEVSVYVSANGVDLPADPTFSFSFGESVGPLELDAGTYQIRVTPAGDRTVVYDSGPVALSASSDLLIAAVDNTVFGNSPVSLLVVNGSETSEILDVNAGAGIRAVHNSAPPTPAVDIYLNEDPDGTPAAGNVAFTETAPLSATLGNYVARNVGDTRIAITPTGATTPIAIDATLPLANGDIKTVIAAGVLADGLDALVFSDDNRRIATEARLRVIHGAVEAQLVDVFLVPAANAGANPGNATPVLNDFEYGESSGYLSVPEGDYVVFITTSDGSTTLLRTGTISLESAKVYTAVARLAPEDTENTASLTLLDDFVVPQT
ncbi:DUF4397 domain-containing protein [Marinobacter hydrocarbonoclasticus]|jgi:hypothetical protein|uniref:DUF4397 domain-containing protein n=1 Tax=Marinobacter TaxID=2742 RepID=UPI0003B871FC|nr:MULTISPECIES: DUF4397 domain-containing protein [Marinobacter]ERS11173.1 hypothetical protein Q673_11510 [Marinobacter sp. EN3]MBY6194509.1 DUF4397 domain-containing protein [Marinobacter nauticus]MBY6215657.1 DUF4397 domain-containing protein [Marinobacter nauticus]